MKIRTLLGGLALAGALTAKIGLESTGPVKRDCEVYQGYTIDQAEGKVVYVFDPQDAYGRTFGRNSPPNREFAMEGNPALRDSLKIGRRYCFEEKEPIAPWASYSKLESIDLGNRVD